MEKPDVTESVPICEAVLKHILAISPTSGRSGSDLRTAIGDFLGYAGILLRYDLAGPPLGTIFDLARAAGITLAMLEDVRRLAEAQFAISVGAILTRDSLIHFTLAAEGFVLADMAFVSRNDVDVVRNAVNLAFQPVEELAADSMDQQGYMGAVSLHAAIIAYLVQTARPLPRILDFSFNRVMTTLTIAYRLYSDAGRADELRKENHNIHPAFMLPAGRALSS